MWIIPSNSTLPTLLSSLYAGCGCASSLIQFFGSLTSFEELSTYDSEALLAEYLVGMSLEAARLAAGLPAGLAARIFGAIFGLG